MISRWKAAKRKTFVKERRLWKIKFWVQNKINEKRNGNWRNHCSLVISGVVCSSYQHIESMERKSVCWRMSKKRDKNLRTVPRKQNLRMKRGLQKYWRSKKVGYFLKKHVYNKIIVKEQTSCLGGLRLINRWQKEGRGSMLLVLPLLQWIRSFAYHLI